MTRHSILSAVFLALAVFFVCYGIFIASAGSGTKFFMVWAAAAVLMLGLAASFYFAGVPPFVRAALIGILAVILAVVAVTWSLVLTDFHDRGTAELDDIIVLGAQVRDSGPSPVLRCRLDTAYEYMKENPRTRCIVSGGKGANEPEAEGDAMKKYLTDRGIAEDRIVSENRSGNTVANLANSSRLLDKKSDSVGIVTNNFHVYRALHIAEKQGYRHVCGIAAPSNPLHLMNNMLRETFGITKDFIKGNI